MSFTKSQVENMNPNTIADMASGWDKLGVAIEQKFDQYVSLLTSTTGGGYWQGLAAEAAQARADGDRRVAIQLVDKLQAAAETARGVATAISTARTNLENRVVSIELQKFTVGEQWGVTDNLADTHIYGPDFLKQRNALRVQFLNDLSTLEQALTTADKNGAATIDGLVANLIAAFTDPASLSGQQGSTDGTALTELADGNGTLSPDALQRLTEAGSLTPEQTEALQSGQKVELSASQMEYLNALMNSLDGKSPKEIEQILSTLPPQARMGLANTLQLVSNQRVTATIQGDAEVPTNGGFGLLPQEIQNSLTRKDLVEDDGSIWIGLNGVADNQAIARVAAMSGYEMRSGSDLDHKILDVAAQYLDRQVRAESSEAILEIDGNRQHPADPKTAQITEPMFTAVADDKFAVATALTDPDTGNRLIENIFRHEWQDDGTAISALFDTSANQAVAAPGTDPADTKRAELHGDIAEAAADYMSKNKDDLLRVPGLDDKTSVGQLNPELIRHLADDLAPYYSTFAGSEAIPGVDHFTQKGELAALYAVLASDPQAGVTAAVHTYAEENVLAAEYGRGERPSTHGQIAGQMHSALVEGTADAKTAMDKNDIYDAQWRQAVESANYDMAKSAATAAFDASTNEPVKWAGGKPMKWLTDIVAPQAKLELLGIVDQATAVNPDNSKPNDAATSMVDSDVTMQNIVNGLLAKDPAVVNDSVLAPLRVTDPVTGDIQLKVDGLDNQQVLKDRLYSAYGIDVDQWGVEYNWGTWAGNLQSPSGDSED
ncbi:TPR repeat region-containing protein [Mycobacterium syngnathidarum]